MSNITIIKRYLPVELHDLAARFDIADEHLADLPDIIRMILISKSIATDQQKQDWFNLLSMMNVDQIEKLRTILLKEQEKLQEIETKYEEKKMEIKKKYLLKWQQMWYVNKISQIREQEEQTKSNDDEEAEKLLEMI